LALPTNVGFFAILTIVGLLTLPRLVIKRCPSMIKCYEVPGNIISFLFIIEVSYCDSCIWCINITPPYYCVIFIIVIVFKSSSAWHQSE